MAFGRSIFCDVLLGRLDDRERVIHPGSAQRMLPIQSVNDVPGRSLRWTDGDHASVVALVAGLDHLQHLRCHRYAFGRHRWLDLWVEIAPFSWTPQIGKILLQESLAPMDVTQVELADHIRVPTQRVNAA